MLVGIPDIESLAARPADRSTGHLRFPGAPGGDTWTFLGDYEHRLVRTPWGWKVDRMTANLRAELGNPELPRLAAERVKTGLGRRGD